MKRGDQMRVTVAPGHSWGCRIISHAKHGAMLVEWVTGTLKGRQGRVLKEFMTR